MIVCSLVVISLRLRSRHSSFEPLSNYTCCTQCFSYLLTHEHLLDAYEVDNIYVVCSRGIALAHLNGPIYAVGGLDDTACFSIVERYDAESNCWTTVQSMNSARGGVAVTAFRVCLSVCLSVCVPVVQLAYSQVMNMFVYTNDDKFLVILSRGDIVV